jgi:hypothetical protein
MDDCHRKKRGFALGKRMTPAMALFHVKTKAPATNG